MYKLNKLLVNHIKSLFDTACILSKRNNTGFIPLPISKLNNRQDLFSYANILNHFIRDPKLSNFNYKKEMIKNKIYIDFPEEIIQLKYKKS